MKVDEEEVKISNEMDLNATVNLLDEPRIFATPVEGCGKYGKKS
jgi:hypothetical protein